MESRSRLPPEQEARVHPGRFITVEGVEGVGKSTNLRFVADELRRAGHAVLVTREPGGTPVGEQIRELLLRPGQEVPAMTELLLMFAARTAHLDAVIRPALAAGQYVVCDRFTDASLAYQGGGRCLPAETILALDRFTTGGLRPDLTLLLDAPLEVADARRAGRGGGDRFEQEPEPFFVRVRNAYRDLAAGEPARIRVVDAGLPLDQVQAQIREILARSGMI